MPEQNLITRSAAALLLALLASPAQSRECGRLFLSNRYIRR